jgi:hypothetical protein
VLFLGLVFIGVGFFLSLLSRLALQAGQSERLGFANGPTRPHGFPQPSQVPDLSFIFL